MSKKSIFPNVQDEEHCRTGKRATLPYLLFQVPSTITDGKFLNHKVLYLKEPGSPDLLTPLSRMEATKDSTFRNLHLFIYLLILNIFIFLIFIYLFFGCVGSQLRHMGSLLRRVGSFCYAQSAPSVRGLCSLQHVGSLVEAGELKSCGARAQLPRGMWDLSSPARDLVHIP